MRHYLSESFTPKFIAYHGDAALKATTEVGIQQHIAAGSLIQNVGWNPATRCGCGNGVVLQGYNRETNAQEHERKLGFPGMMAFAVEHTFENHPKDQLPAARNFVLRTFRAAQAGAILDDIQPRLIEWALTHLLALTQQGSYAHQHLAYISSMYAVTLEKLTITQAQWQDAATHAAQASYYGHHQGRDIYLLRLAALAAKLGVGNPDVSMSNFITHLVPDLISPETFGEHLSVLLATAPQATARQIIAYQATRLHLLNRALA